MTLTKQILSGKRTSLRNMRMFLLDPEIDKTYTKHRFQEMRGRFKYLYLHSINKSVFLLKGMKNGEEHTYYLVYKKKSRSKKIKELLKSPHTI